MSREINAAIIELNTAFDAFKQANDERLGALEKKTTDPLAVDKVERINALMDQISAKLEAEKRPKGVAMRPFFGESLADSAATEQKALCKYILMGHQKGLKSIETKALNGADSESGACLLPNSIHDTIGSMVQDICPMMGLANVVNLDYGKGPAYQYPRMRADFDEYWKDQKGKNRWEKGLEDNEKNAAGSETPKIDMKSIPLHTINYTPRISSDLMENSGFNIIAWLQTGISHYIGLLCNEAFIHGDGAKKPRGLLHAGHLVDGAEKYKIQVHKSGQNGDFPEGTEYETLWTVLSSLESRYHTNAGWLFSREVMKKIRLIKSPGDQRYLWTPEHSISGNTSSLLGYPVTVCDAFKPLSDNETSLFFGNFKQGYTIVHRPDITIVRDEFSAKPDIELLLRYRFGGDVTDGSALKALKFSAA